MKKNILSVIFLIMTISVYAQIGVNMEKPQATLDIKAKSAVDTDKLEGLLIPRLSKQKAYTMGGNNEIQESTMIYINDLSSSFILPSDGTESRVTQITENGFYFWNGSQWVRSIGKNGQEWEYNTSENAIFVKRAKENSKDIVITNEGNVGIGTDTPVATLNVKRIETSATKNVNIHGVRSDVTVTGTPEGGNKTNLDVNGYWANVKSDGGASVNGIYVHARQTKSNFSLYPLPNPQILLDELSLVSGTYGSAEVENSLSFYIAVGAGGMSESSQYGVNTGVNGVARNSKSMNFGVNAIAKATNDQIKGYYKNIAPSPSDILFGSSFSAAVSAFNPSTGKNDYAIYVKGAKSKIEGKLEVTGDLMASNFPVPDYVFEKYYKGHSNIKEDYNFKTLDEVEDFVKKNGHLPGYKSAKEVSKEGFVNIGATQLMNIEKIEELYLHTIEQGKALKEKNSEIATLKEELQNQKEILETKEIEIKELEVRLGRIEKLLEK